MNLPVSFALQSALYGTLAADSVLQGLLGSPARIFDAVPTEPIFPLLTIGEVRTRSFPELVTARAHDVRLNAYSRWGGRKEAKDIVDQCVSLLSGAGLVVTGHRLVQSRFIFSDIIRRNDPDTFHAVMRFRIVTEELSS